MIEKKEPIQSLLQKAHHFNFFYKFLSFLSLYRFIVMSDHLLIQGEVYVRVFFFSTIKRYNDKNDDRKEGTDTEPFAKGSPF